MQSLILCRYGEITIKGSNRALFERCLEQNIRTMLKNAGIICTIQRKRSRTFVHVTNPIQQEATLAVLQRVFGLTSVSPALMVEPTYAAIESAIRTLLGERKFSTFRVTVQRLQKIFEPTPNIQHRVGAWIEQQFGKRVNLTAPDIDLRIEIIDKAYVFVDRLSAPGGLPAGIEGTVLAMMESDADALAAWLVMKRGCAIIPVQRKEFPLTMLTAYGAPPAVIRIQHPKELDQHAVAHRAEALVVGQTLGTLNPLQTTLPVLRPLIGYMESEIAEKTEELCTRL